MGEQTELCLGVGTAPAGMRTVFWGEGRGRGGVARERREARGRTTQQGLQVSLQMRFDAHGRCLERSGSRFKRLPLMTMLPPE